MRCSENKLIVMPFCCHQQAAVAVSSRQEDESAAMDFTELMNEAFMPSSSAAEEAPPSHVRPYISAALGLPVPVLCCLGKLPAADAG